MKTIVIVGNLTLSKVFSVWEYPEGLFILSWQGLKLGKVQKGRVEVVGRQKNA